MANIHDLFPSRFLKSIDLRGSMPTVTVVRVAFEVVGHGPKAETMPIVYFAGHAKGLKLNKTLATTIAAIAGTPETDAWGGTVLTLFGTSATFGKDSFPVVRVKAVATPRTAAPDTTHRPAGPPSATLAPAGYLAWFDRLRGAAMLGLPTLEREWVNAPKDFRIYLAATTPGAQAELKAIASRMVKASGGLAS